MVRIVGTMVLIVLAIGGAVAGSVMLFPGAAAMVAALSSASDVPAAINHQGVVSVNGVRFMGPGLFRFAIVDPDTGNNVWTNDGTEVGTANAPTDAVSLSVVDGVYSVALGDSDLANMTVIPPALFRDGNLKLRIWFDDGTHGNQQLAPDHVLTSVPYAMTAANGVPVGTVVSTALTTAPSGWLICDGSAVSRTTYPDLFAGIGTTYGAGDESTTFNLPDLRQRFPLGKANSGTGATLGSTGGTIDYTHSHSLSDAGQAQITMSETGFIGMRRVNTSPSWTQNYMTNVSVTASSPTRSSGAALAGQTDDTSTAYNPPFISLNYMIKY